MRRLMILGHGPAAAYRNAATAPVVRAVERSHVPSDWRLTTTAQHGGTRLQIAVASRYWLEVVGEMFAEWWDAVDGLDPSVILDLGSNVGAFIAYFRGCYSRAVGAANRVRDD